MGAAPQLGQVTVSAAGWRFLRGVACVLRVVMEERVFFLARDATPAFFFFAMALMPAQVRPVGEAEKRNHRRSHTSVCAAAGNWTKRATVFGRALALAVGRRLARRLDT